MQEKSIVSIEERKEIFDVEQHSDEYEEKLNALQETGLLPDAFLFKIGHLPFSHQYVLSLPFIIQQGHVLEGWENATPKVLEALAQALLKVDQTFEGEGGLIGYQRVVDELLSAPVDEAKRILPPVPVEIDRETDEVKEYIYRALEDLESFCELYPVGGAADRLNLSDPDTKKRLPAAKLGFLDKSLLEGLIDDVIAREYLAYKFFRKQVITPIGLMTSSEKGNHEHILGLCENKKWFGRGEDAFFLFSQPLVPCISQDGKWVCTDPCTLELKPGGHGMIWLLAKEKKVFHFFHRLHRRKILLRQINNPIAGVDTTLLSFMGYGITHNKDFGFASCQRRAGAKEGMNVVVEKEDGQFLTNVEYCDFEKYGVDNPEKGFAHFPANTNILFADCDAIYKALEKNPLPGRILNFSTKAHGKVSARLETMMQNIADVIPATDSYLTISPRRKTIASAKKAYVEREGIFETPFGAFYTYLENAHELLTQHCAFTLPEHPSIDLFEKNGPSFVFTYHPALGPLYSIIGQKLQGGTMQKGATLKLEIADIFMKKVAISGSLFITAENLVGHIVNDITQYSEMTGKCLLEEVSIDAALTIALQGNSAFVAQGVCFTEDLSLIVPDGMVATAIETAFGLSITYMPKQINYGAQYTFDSSKTPCVSFEQMRKELLA